MNETQKSSIQATLGLAALLILLEEKGIITEDEYKKAYETARDTLIKETVEQIKKQI